MMSESKQALAEFVQPQSVGELTFPLLVAAWKRLRRDRIDDLRRLAPNLTTLNKVFIRKTEEDNNALTVEFVGLDTAALDSTRAAEVRRMIEIWLQRISGSVQKVRNTNTVLTLRLSKTLRVGNLDLTPTQDKMSQTPTTESKYEQVVPSGITQIIVARGN